MTEQHHQLESRITQLEHALSQVVTEINRQNEDSLERRYSTAMSASFIKAFMALATPAQKELLRPVGEALRKSGPGNADPDNPDQMKAFEAALQPFLEALR